MRKIKFLPLLLVAPMLVGCNNVKSPKFAKEGDLVLSDKFIENFTKAGATSEFAKEGDLTDSYIIKGKNKGHTEEVTTRGKAKPRVRTIDIESTNEYKYDVKNHVLSLKASGSTVDSLKTKDGSDKETTKQKLDYTMQGGQVNGVQHVLSIDNKAKLYNSIQELSGAITVPQVLDTMFKQVASGYYSGIQNELNTFSNLPEGDERIGHYKFYQNNNIFTLVQEYTDETDRKDAEDKTIFLRKDTYFEKYQLDTTAGKWQFKYYFEGTTHVEYKQAYYSFAAGDIYDEVEQEATEGTLTAKDVKVKAKDLSKLTAFGF